YAYNAVGKGFETDGGSITITLSQSTCGSSLDKSNAISPFINGHVLVVAFSENLGQVSVEVATTAGASVESLSVSTPNCVQVYIPNAGNYIVTFTLSNGDVYAGEFTVTD
ncbi:MAG: DUF3244 domain-containing protein, partial [Bacteroidales bacterium]|nr:DUF3244 domain-containing protein [Bacteroidales bacterium]